MCELATQGDFLRSAGVPLSAVRGVVSIDTKMPDITMANAPDDQEPQVLGQVNMVYGTDPSRWTDASPIHHLEKGSLRPLLLFHANDPASLSARENLLFAQRWGELGGQVEIEPAREKDHSHLGRDIGNEHDWITETVMAFVHRCLSPTPPNPSQ